MSILIIYFYINDFTFFGGIVREYDLRARGRLILPVDMARGGRIRGRLPDLAPDEDGWVAGEDGREDRVGLRLSNLFTKIQNLEEN